MASRGVLGAVLAGGRSSRFGSDKAAATLGDATLAEHAASAIRPYVDEVVVVGERLGGLADLPRADLGPLGGIAAALDHAAEHGFRCVLTIGCDMPIIPSGLIEMLLRREPSFCADAPVLGFWPATCCAKLLAHIEAGDDRSVRGWARSIGALPIASSVPLANVNTTADLARLEQDAMAL